MVQAAAVLSEYEPDVVEYVTSPRTGIQRKQKWPPTTFEIGEACDAAVKQLVAERKVAAQGWHWNGEKWVGPNG